MATGGDAHVTVPGFAEPSCLIQKHRAFLGADPGGDGNGQGGVVDRAFGDGFGFVQLQRLVHRCFQKRAQIGEGRDRDHAGDTIAHFCLHRDIAAEHAGHKMAPCGVPGEIDRAFDIGRSLFHRAGDRAGDLGDARLRRQRIGGHGDSEAARCAAPREVRPVGSVEFVPVAAVDENHETFGTSCRVEQVEFLALMRTVGCVEARATDGGFGLAKLARGVDPSVDVVGGVRYEIRICIGDIVFHLVLGSGVGV